MKNIGGNIRKARERLGYSQAQLAYKLGISKQAVSNYENNRREPDLATIDTIAMVLKVPVTSTTGSDKDKAGLMGHEDYRTTKRHYQTAELDALKAIISQLY